MRESKSQKETGRFMFAPPLISSKRAGLGVPMYDPVKGRQVKALDFLLDANRNLLLTLAVAFSMGIFAVGADALIGGTAVISAVTVLVALALVLIVVGIHMWMVFAHGNLIGSHILMWYLLPGGVAVVAFVPLVTYLVRLYS